MWKAVRKYLNLIVKLPNGTYIDSSNAYTEILFAVDVQSLHTINLAEYLSECCNITEHCFKKHWISRAQYESIYSEIRDVSYSYYYDSEEEREYYADMYDF